MRSSESRRGSALLIVLGFLSFMVVSAVAFSIYMRSERVPSSVLRRSVAARHLVKAALAEAMAEVDQAICDDPFPGAITANSRRDNGNRYYDLWLGRVFMPPEPSGEEDEPNDMKDTNQENSGSGKMGGRLVPSERIDETVPVLTLEALGYLPPVLVNDVRYLARTSWSSKWRYFNFDAGRCAYVAVNVSDFFDINRAAIDGVRTSCPTSRISMSYAFADDNKTDGSAKARAFAQKLAAAKAANANYPFTSMMDFNLALGSQSQQDSAFVNYVGKKKSPYYENLGQAFERQFFVTDSWYTNSDEQVKLTRLRKEGTRERGQPFAEGTISMEGNVNRRTSVQTLNTSGAMANELFKNRLSMADRVTLFDYLDRDDVPTSLGFPSLERTPMVVGVQPTLAGAQIKVAKDGPTRSESGAEGHEKTTYSLADVVQAATARMLYCFPFKRGDALNGKTFRAQAMLRIFLCENASAMRFDGVSMDDTTLRPTKDLWQQHAGASSEMDDHSIMLFSTPQTLSLPTVRDEQDVVKQAAFVFAAAGLDYTAHPLLTEDKVYDIRTDELGNRTWASSPKRTDYSCGFHPITASGDLDTSTQPNGTYYFGCAVWVRITDANGHTVDVVPANVADDSEYNNLDVNSGLYPLFQQYCGQGVPILRFSDANASAHQIKYSTDESEGLPKYVAGQGLGNLSPKALYAIDPRYNYAPENWFETTSISESGWLQEVHNFMDQAAERDPDVFMFVSNQGYLQSMAEFAFLPRLGGLGTGGVSFGNNGGYNGTLRTRADDVADSAIVWQTYRAYTTDGLSGDQLFSQGISDGDDGVKVNPYTDDDQIFLAALANTPYDWWAAGTNVSSQSASFGQNPDDYAEKRDMLQDLSTSYEYAFNESKGQESRLAYDDLVSIANVIRSKFRSSPGASLLDQWRSLDWFGDPDQPKKFLGVDLDEPMHSVDRKYLFGFWKNCFANKQQLFLIFVRAEPTSAGGDSGGKTAQLGGRAVALVWRDPASTGNEVNGNRMNDNRKPHRMRVLFYHQFE